MSEEEKQKKLQYHRERNKNLSEEEKESWVYEKFCTYISHIRNFAHIYDIPTKS